MLAHFISDALKYLIPSSSRRWLQYQNTAYLEIIKIFKVLLIYGLLEIKEITLII